MTRDELLNGIERQIQTQTDEHLLFNALRAVIELHSEDTFHSQCDGCGDYIPCSTIQAIEKELA